MSPLTQAAVIRSFLATIGFVIAMAGFFVAMFVRKSREENDS